MTFTAAAGSVLSVLAVCAAFAGQASHDRLASGWEEWWAEREEQVAGELEGALSSLLRNADRAAVEVAASLPGPAPGVETLLRRARAATGVSALAVYDADGRLQAWEGVHLGPVPPGARAWRAPYAYHDGPLFGYLYSIAPVPETGGVVVAALLMRADLPATLGAGPGDFSRRFRERVGEEIRITPADRAAGGAIWDLRWEGEVLFSVEVLAPDRTARLASVRVTWGRVVAGLGAAAWILLLLGSGGTRGDALGAAGVLAVGASLLPLGPLLGVPWLFAPVNFLLPGPWRVTLGRLLAMALAAVTVAGMLARSGLGPPWGRVLGMALVAAGLPLVVGWLGRGVSPDFLAGREWGWVTYQATLTVVLATLLRGALRLGASRGEGSTTALAVGLGLAMLMAAVLGAVTRRVVPLPLWPAAFWVLPTLLAARGLGSRAGGRSGPLGWLTAAVLAGTVALPWAWGQRVEARMTVAEARMERVGMRADPYLEFLLYRMGARADSLHARGVTGLELLLSGWAGSGLAQEGYPVRLTLWSPGGVPREELRIGVGEPRPLLAAAFLDQARIQGTTSVRRFEQSDAHYLALVPLSDGSVVSAVVPPLRGLAPPEPLGPLFVPRWEDEEPVTLVPLLAGEGTGAQDSLVWSPTARGWRGEAVVTYPEGLFRAWYDLPFPPGEVAVARGALLLLLSLLVVGMAWGPARATAPALPLEEGGARLGTVLRSFQARVTAVLFLFFLVPALAFGLQTHRTLEGAAQRTAEALAFKAVNDAASAFLDVQGELDLLSSRVQADLLLYLDGALEAGSPREMVDMGLFEGWIPVEVRGVLEGRQEVLAARTYAWGGWAFTVAYRRLPGGEVLASSAPLRAGAAALRSREVADLVLFSVVLGAGLSLGLALLAGRSLARPIQVLQVASERVGAGNLRVRLPEDRTDEFGAVFAAFNRMVRRLRRNRRELVRSSRRTRAIVEEAATGVVALDADGVVALANPRAADLLGVPIRTGEPLPGGSEARDDLLHWLAEALQGDRREGGTELVLGGRRIRVRARRIAREGGGSGAVVSLEDVTDELRAERILAWGEMAQQVAHEVKNPLTPIKLAVQHMRRAWEDRRPDFGDILERNVAAILREIDRLAGIARSFARFGAPGAAEDAPLTPVRLEEVVEELLALYGHGDEEVRFLGRVAAGLPPVQARESEVKEVLVNLLENARAALAKGGEVVIEAEQEGSGVELRVRDDGAGIPPDLLPRVFEPHFSTRSTGAGLGLAIVRRLVESWGGTVVAQSTPGRGTVICMSLRPWDAPGDPHGTPTRAGGGGEPGEIRPSSGSLRT